MIQKRQMPIIAIVSVGSDVLNLRQDDFEIAMIVENKANTARGLFGGLPAGKKGVMILLGNPVFKSGAEGVLCAREITDWVDKPKRKEPSHPELVRAGNSEPSRFRLLFNYQIEVNEIIWQALNASPEKTAYLQTDTQSGEYERQIQETSPVGFWTLHDTKGLAWNTLYRLRV